MRLREILDEHVAPREQRRHENQGLVFENPGVMATADLASLERSFARLNDDERDALRMIVCEGKSYAEAARSLGVTVTTINNWKHRGIGKLRKHLAAEQVLGDALSSGMRARTG